MSAVVYHRRAQTVKRVLWSVMVLIGLGLLIVLYSFKTMAQTARKSVHDLETKIQIEEASIQLLKAEIVFLERPDRLQDLSETVLGLEPTGFEVQNSLDILRAIPLREWPPLAQSSKGFTAEAALRGGPRP